MLDFFTLCHFIVELWKGHKWFIFQSSQHTIKSKSQTKVLYDKYLFHIGNQIRNVNMSALFMSKQINKNKIVSCMCRKRDVSIQIFIRQKFSFRRWAHDSYELLLYIRTVRRVKMFSWNKTAHTFKMTWGEWYFVIYGWKNVLFKKNKDHIN